jgi:hypothetical protein
MGVARASGQGPPVHLPERKLVLKASCSARVGTKAIAKAHRAVSRWARAAKMQTAAGSAKADPMGNSKVRQKINRKLRRTTPNRERRVINNKVRPAGNRATRPMVNSKAHPAREENTTNRHPTVQRGAGPFKMVDLGPPRSNFRSGENQLRLTVCLAWAYSGG